MIRLIRPTAEFKARALQFKREFYDAGESVINGSELLDRTDDYDKWLTNVTRNSSAGTVSPDWVVTDTFFAVDDRDKIVGIIDLRHTLNEDLGNCGYRVCPSERGKGYATEMLRQLLSVARESGMTELHLSVERGNMPSVRTIVKNGGVYERSFEFEGVDADIYRIALRP